MFTSLEEFFADWKYESEATQKILRELSDASLAQAVTTQDRTLGRMAWHLVTAIPEMSRRTGLATEGPEESAPVPATAAAIADTYGRVVASLEARIREDWNDASLGIVDDMYGEKWARAQTLEILIRHQIHHRGQMTVLMRQAGLKVPGVYGPSREEWAQFGQAAPAV